MTIEEINNSKLKLEKDISDMINEFQDKNGVEIYNIRIDTIESTCMSNHKKVLYTTTEVEVRL